jgi:hypothetical protein
MRPHFSAALGIGLGIIVLSFVPSGQARQSETESQTSLGSMAQISSAVSPRDEVNRIKERYEAHLMSIEGVVGVGVGTCDTQSCIKVFVLEKTSELMEAIPKELEGTKVSVEETGHLRTLPSH